MVRKDSSGRAGALRRPGATRELRSLPEPASAVSASGHAPSRGPAFEALIAKLSAASEGSDWLNLDIYRTLGAEHFGCCYADDEIPDWTGSITAALKLKPADANCHGYDAYPGDKVCAYFSRNNVADGHWLSEGQGATPALAFCVAALKRLRALSAQPGEGK